MANPSYKILKVREWLKFRNPDYEGFVEHVKIWDKEGIPYGSKDLIKLAKVIKKIKIEIVLIKIKLSSFGKNKLRIISENKIKKEITKINLNHFFPFLSSSFVCCASIKPIG